MRIQLKKGRDGRDTLACHRDDGSSTWTPLHPSMAVHDLTHYAVETVLNVLDAFFGLLARGWDVRDFEDRAKRTGMPAAAMVVEVIVGQLDLERLPANRCSHEAFLEALRLAMAGQGLACPDVTAVQLAAIRERRAALARQWAGLSPGESMELTF